MPDDARDRSDTTITVRPEDKAVFAELAEGRGHVPQWSMFRIILNHFIQSAGTETPNPTPAAAAEE